MSQGVHFGLSQMSLLLTTLSYYAFIYNKLFPPPYLGVVMSFFIPPPPIHSIPLVAFFSDLIPNLVAWVVGVQFVCETLSGLELPRVFAESEACLHCA